MVQPAASREKRRPDGNGSVPAVLLQKSPVGADTPSAAVKPPAPPGRTDAIPPKQQVPKPKESIISIENVQKFYHVGKTDVHVLRDINIQLYPQEFIIILGPSGSGKSTLLNTILGLEFPSTGKVVIQGVDITKKSPNAIAKLRYHNFGVVFQRSDWIRSINTLNNVALPLAISNVGKRERIARAWQKLKELEMSDYALYTPTDLSGGQQQKVSLARALINDPPIVVADEPTGNLDSVSADKVMDLLRRLNEVQHKTIIMVTHNIDYVRYATRTVNIRDGRVVQGM